MVPTLLDVTDDDVNAFNKRPKQVLMDVTDEDVKKKDVTTGGKPLINLSNPLGISSGGASDGFNIQGVPSFPFQKDNIPGKLVTGVGQPATEKEVTETKEQRDARYNSVFTSSADDIVGNYHSKVSKAMEETANPVTFMNNIIDISMLQQSREGKAANVIMSIANGTANLDDLNYLKSVAPKALMSFVTPDSGVAIINDDTLRNFLAKNNTTINETKKMLNAKMYQDEAAAINTKLSSLQVDTMKMDNKDYVTSISDQYKKNKEVELTEVDKLYPKIARVVNGDGFAEGYDSEFIKANKKSFSEWSAKRHEVDQKYSQLNYYLGKAYGNAYAKQNPTFTPKEIGEKVIQFADPDLYAMGQKAGGDYGIKARDVALLGVQSLYSTGHEGAIALANDDELTLDKTYPDKIIAETYHRLGAELYKGDNWFFNAAPSMKAMDEAAKNLPDANLEAYTKYIRPRESKMIGTDIPMSGLINKIGEGFSHTAINTVKGIEDIVGARTNKELAQEALGEDTKFADVGEFSVAKGKLAEINAKIKTNQATVQDLNEKRDLEKYTGVRSKAQEIVDGTGNLTGVVLFQALGTKALSGLTTVAAKGLGLMPAVEDAVALTTTEKLGETFGLTKNAINEVSAIGLMYASSLDDGKKKALELFPDDKDSLKRNLYAQTWTSIMALSSRVFKDEKILDPFGKEISPGIANVVNNITEKKVSREVLGSAISDVLKDGVKLTGEFLKQDIKVASEMALINMGQSVATAVIAPAKFNFNDAYNEAIHAFTSTFLEGGIVSGFASVNSVKNNKIAMPLLSRLGVDAEFTDAIHKEVTRQEQQQIITPEQAFMKRNIIETAKVINEKNIPQVMESHDLNESGRVKYFGQLLNESLLKRKADMTTDGVLKESLGKQIAASEIIRKAILENKVYVTDEYGVQTEAAAIKDNTPVEQTAFEQAVKLITAHKDNVEGMYKLAAENSPETLVKDIADQALGRLADGSVHPEGPRRESMERTFTPEIVAKAIEAYPMEAQPKVEEAGVVAGEIYHPLETGDLADSGPVEIISHGNGNVNVKFEDDTYHSFTADEFRSLYKQEATAPTVSGEIDNVTKEPYKSDSPDATVDTDALVGTITEEGKYGGIEYRSSIGVSRMPGAPAEVLPYGKGYVFWNVGRKGEGGNFRDLLKSKIDEHGVVYTLSGASQDVINASRRLIESNPEYTSVEVKSDNENYLAIGKKSVLGEGINPVSTAVDFADLFQRLKFDNKNILNDAILGIPKAIWNGLMDTVSASIKAGRAIKDAIADGIKYVKDNHKKPFDETALQHVLEGHVKSFSEKPVRKDGEGKADYAVRVLEWRRKMLNEGSAFQQAEALKNSQAEVEFIKKVNEGSELLAKDMNITHEDFNKQLGLPVGDFDTYVSALQYMKSSNKEAGKLLNSLRASDPKKVVASEISLLKKQLLDIQKGYVAGSKDAKDQIKAIKETVNQMLADYNEQGLLDGVKYSTKDLLMLASRVNNVVTEASFDHLNNFMQHLIDKAEYGKFLLQAGTLAKEIKQAIKSKIVSQNDIQVLKGLANLNPVLLQNIETYSAMLHDVAKTRTVKEIERKYTNEEIKEFTDAARQNEVDVKATSITTRYENLVNSQGFKDAVREGRISQGLEGWATRKVNDILVDNNTSMNEKQKALNDIDSIVGMFARSLYNKESFSPHDIEKGIADQPTGDADGVLRTQLEDLAKAQQDTIDIIDETTLSDDQKKSLGIMKDVDITGRDSKTLKLFSNVLNNVITNGDNSGVGVFDVMKRGQDNAKPLLQYLKDTGKKILDRSAKTKMGKELSKLRFVTLNKSAIMTLITNNNAEISTKLDNAVALNDMTSGFAKVSHEYHDRISKPLGDIFTKYPDLHNDPDSIVRLSLFSFLNQSVADSTPMERSAQLQRRINIVKADIALKVKEGTESDRMEGVREQKILDEFQKEILDATGKDIYNDEALSKLTKEEFDKLDNAEVGDKFNSLLYPGEKAVYSLFKNYQAELQPQHADMVNYYLNEKYEPWENYMKDSYRQLGSGLVDVELKDDAKLGFNSADKAMDAASGSTIQRTKGDPLAKKSGEPQRVLNMHFYNAQSDGVRGVLEDIHSLPQRMAADEGFLNPQLKDELGNDNHKLLKTAVTNYVKNELGVGKMGEPALKTIKKGLDVIAKIGTRRQLLSMSAYIKQFVDTLIKTPVNLGKDAGMFWEATKLSHNEDALGLIKQNGISQRKDNLAGLNIISQEQLSSKDNIVDDADGKSVLSSATNAVSDLMNRFVNHVNKGGVQKESFIEKPIKYGDYTPATYAWLAYYGQWLVNHGKADKFENIDWGKENAGQDREAAAYAEQMTSKKLNENTKAGRSQLINDPSIGLHLAKNLLFPFGSFNMHNWNIMVEDVKTLVNKKNIIDADYRKNEGATAAKSLMSSIVGETVFQGIKRGISFAITKYALTGLVALYGKIFNSEDDKETIDLLNAAVEKSIAKEEETGFQRWYTETIGNLFFGGFGNTPQNVIEKGINTATSSDFFYQPDLTVNQQLDNQGNLGMVGAAFSGMGSLAQDGYRAIFEPNNRFGEEVNVSNAQKGIVAVTMLSELMTMAGRGDADINRAIEKVRTYMDRGLKKDYKDPNYEDMEEFFNRPTKITQSGADYKLNKEQQDYMIAQRAERLNQLKNSGVPEKQQRELANSWAKAMLYQKYGEELFKDRIEKKK